MNNPPTGNSPRQQANKKKKRRRKLTRTQKPVLRAGDELVVPTRVDITDGIAGGASPHPTGRNKNRVYVDSYLQSNPAFLLKFWYKRSGGTGGNMDLIYTAMDNLGNASQEYVVVNLSSGNNDNGYLRTAYVH